MRKIEYTFITLARQFLFISIFIYVLLHLSVVTEILVTGANDVYVVSTQEKKEFLIPAVSEFIKIVDIDNNLIVIDPIEGMIE